MKTNLRLFICCGLLISSQFPLFAQTDRTAAIARAAEALKPSLVTQRRDFHVHPELSNQEARTAKVIAEKLKALGLEDIKINVGKHGVTALLKGKLPGGVVAVRADMDGLPIQENIDVPYKSQNNGVKHACGHDAHMTIQLGVAELLSQMRDQIHGTIKFIFQPAEEGVPPGERAGAKYMIDEGALQNPRPSAIFGLHVMPNIEVGTIGLNSGAAMASADRISITIRGKKVHGAYPHDGVDAIVVAAECISALQSIRSRRINTQDPLVITIGSIHGGNRFNIIADEVQLEGTMRTLSEDARNKAKAMIDQTLKGITAAYGATYELSIPPSVNPVTYNDPQLVAATLPVLQRVLGAANISEPKPQMGAEDFSMFQQEIPGVFYFLGVGNQAKGITAMIHTAEFDLDEAALVVGVKTMANVLLDFLDRAGKE